MTNYHKHSGLKQIHLFSHSSGGSSPKSRWRPGLLPLEALRGISSILPLIGVWWCSFGPQVRHSSLRLCPHMVLPSLSLSVPSSSYEVSAIGFRTPSTPVWPHLKELHLQWPHSQTRSHLKVLDGREFGGTHYSFHCTVHLGTVNDCYNQTTCVHRFFCP